MKLYTINATPVQVKFTDIENAMRVEKYPQEIAKLLGEYGIDGFTIYEVNGFWQGISERSFKIEIASDGEISREMLERLRDEYEQDAIMLTNPDNTVEFI